MMVVVMPDTREALIPRAVVAVLGPLVEMQPETASPDLAVTAFRLAQAELTPTMAVVVVVTAIVLVAALGPQAVLVEGPLEALLELTEQMD